MKIPSKIKAFTRTYAVIRDDDETSRLGCWGMLDAFRDEIILKKRGLEFTEGHEKQVFLHELIHLVDSNFHLELTEEETQLLAVGLTMIMEANKLNFSSVE